MKVLVCGGRDYNNEDHTHLILDLMNELHGPITCVVHGACCTSEGNLRGADRWANTWALKRQVKVIGYPAEWDKYGRAAGPRRNQQMLKEERPDIVLAMPGGSGTKDMVQLAEIDGMGRASKDGADGTAVLYREGVRGVRRKAV